MTTDIETLAELQNKVFRRAAAIRKLTAVEQINMENDWTEFVKKLVDFGNKRYLRNYSLGLKMEVNEDDDMEIIGGH
jgi:hypothetical protein